MKQARLERACPDNDNAVDEAELQAYVDGQLEGRRRAAIESYLAAHPGEAERLADYRAQNIGLHALFDPGPGSGSSGSDRELPPRLVALAHAFEARLAEGARQVASPRRLRSLAAAVALLLAGGTAGWIAVEQLSPRSQPLVALTRQAAETPLQPIAAPANVPAAAGKRDVAAWLAAQPGEVPVTVPDLEDLGFRLTGEDILPGAGGPPAAQLHYQDEAGQRVTLTMRRGGEAGHTSFTFTRNGDAAGFMWQDSHMAYSLIGSMAQEKLLEIAETVSRSLREEAAPAPQETAQAPAAARAGEEAVGLSGGPPTTPAVKPLPLIDSVPLIDPGPLNKAPLMPVPLPESGEPKDT